MEEFLKLVLPERGVYYAVAFTKTKRRIHYPHHDIPSLAERLQSIDVQDATAYHACGAFKEESYMEWSDKLGKEIRKYRTHSNARSAKAFWVDLDVDATTPGKYASQKEAANDVLRLMSLGMPAPTVVSSGYGLHLYWPLVEELLPAPWNKFAFYLKSLLTAHGIKQDMTRTADISSVLRPPGTRNKKNGGCREVECVSMRGPYTIEVIFAALKKLAKAAPVAVKSPIDTRPQVDSVIDTSALDYSGPPANANLIAEHCPQIAHFRETKGNVSEPMWYITLGVLAYCEDGERISHEWSRGHAGYSATETSAKIVQWKSAATGPATCSKFEQEDGTVPSRCASCKFKGKIRTPATLGQTVVPAPEVKTTTGDIVVAPVGFFRGKDGLYTMQDDAAGIKQKFFDYDFYIEDIATHPHGYEVATFKYQRPHVGLVSFQAKTSLFNKLDSAWQTLADNGIYMKHKSTAETMALYTRSYLSELHARKAVMQSYTNLGWKDDGSFLLGRYHIGKDFMRDNPMVPKTLPVAEPIQMAGELAPWVKLTEVFQSEDMHTLGFAFLAGLSAPLFHFTGFGGILVNMVGTTGIGKTSVQRLVNSLYGHPEKMLAAAKDTPKNHISRLAAMGHLPVCFDELGNMHKERASNLILTITQGRDMGRNNNDGSMRRQDSWNTAAITSSNHPLLGKLADLKADYDAEAMRIIEFSVHVSEYFRDPENGKTFNKTIIANHGKAGVLFIQQLVRMGADNIRAEVEAAEQWLKANGFAFATQERYWENTFVCAKVAGSIAQRCGLLRFDTDAILRSAYAKLLGLRTTLKEEKSTVFDLLAHYVNDNFDKIIVTVRIGDVVRTENGPRAGRVEGRITYFQQGSDVVGGELMVSCAAMRTWLLKQYGDFKEFKDELIRQMAMPDDGMLLPMGTGTIYKTPPTKVLRINLAHPRLLPMLDRYVPQEPNVVQLEIKK